MSESPPIVDLVVMLAGVAGAVAPLWIYVFGGVGFELPVMLALSFIAAYVWITGVGR